MAIPYQTSDSSQQGILQGEDIPPRWDQDWGTNGKWPIVNTIEGQSLENFLQQWIAGLANLDETLVRPRWQPEPPNLPDYCTNWIACGINRRRQIGLYAWVGHYCDNEKPGWDQAGSWDPNYGKWDPRSAGHSQMQRHEEFEVLCSFYGPEGETIITEFTNNLMVWQNTALLRLVGLAFADLSDETFAPELIRQRWWHRIDKTVTLRRIIRRHYPVLNLLRASVAVVTDTGYEQKSDISKPDVWDDGANWDGGDVTWDQGG